MQLYFTIAYISKPGETVFVTLNNKKEELLVSFALEYKDENTWSGSIFFDQSKTLKKTNYQITVRNELSFKEAIVLNKGSVNLKKNRFNSIDITVKKIALEYIIDVRKSKPFKKVFNPINYHSSQSCSFKKATHIFKVSYPLLEENIFICISGSAKKLNLFNNENPILFTKNKNNKSVLKFNFSKEIFPIEYKIAFYDIEKKMYCRF